MNRMLINFKYRRLAGQAILLMLLIACKKNHDEGGLSPHITFAPNSGLAGTVVTIKGHGFSTDTALNDVRFNGTRSAVLNATDTQLIVAVPEGSTGAVEVTVGGRTAKGDVYIYQALSIRGIRPAEGPAGTIDTISGSGFLYRDKGQDWTPAVYFNGKKGFNLAVTDTQIVVAVPDSAGTGPVSITLSNLKAQGADFAFLKLDAVKPLTGNAGTTVRIRGSFGLHYQAATVSFNGKQATFISATDSLLIVKVPVSDTTGRVNITIGSNVFHGPIFTFVQAPAVTHYTPLSGPVGTSIKIAGAHFSTEADENIVRFNGIQATVVSPGTTTELTAVVPVGASTGMVMVITNDQAATGPVFTVQNLGIAAIDPVYFVPPATITITGTGFSTIPGDNRVFFNGTPVTVTSANDSQLVVKVPAGVIAGPVTINTGGLSATGPDFSTMAVATLTGQPGLPGLTNGPASQAQFMQPVGLAVDASGNLYVADAGANNIRKVSPDGTVSVLAGDAGGSAGYTDAKGVEARFNSPNAITLDGTGNLFVAEQNNSDVRKIAPDGTVTTFASLPGMTPDGLAFDKSGNLYVLDFYSSNGILVLDPSGNQLSPLPSGQSSFPFGIAVDDQGNVYTADIGFNTGGAIFKNAQAIAHLPYSGSDFFGPRQITFDKAGRLIVVDSYSHSVYRIDPSNGYGVTTLTGMFNPNSGYVAGYLDGALPSALFNQPAGVAVDASGVIYVCEAGNFTIRKISLQ